MSLPDTLSNIRRIEGGFATAIPEDWMQGRTSYGGFSAALALEAARGLAPDLPPLRSAQVSFVGPLSGEVEVRARMLRRGKNASWRSVNLKTKQPRPKKYAAGNSKNNRNCRKPKTARPIAATNTSRTNLYWMS